LEPLTGLLLAGLAVAALSFAHTLVKLVRTANLADWGSPWINLLDGVNRLFCFWFHRMSPTRLPLPAEGPAIVVANHVSGLDPLLLIGASPRPLRFLIARDQFERFGLQWLFRAVGCLPVDRGSRPDIAFRAALRTLHDGQVIALFPHGRIRLPGEAPGMLKPGAVRLAVATGCGVFPVRIQGVRAEGRVVSAVFVRSHVKLELYPPLRPALGEAELTARLGSMLG